MEFFTENSLSGEMLTPDKMRRKGKIVEKDKSLKIRESLHKEISDRAELLGMKLGRFSEALLSAGMRLKNDEILDELKKLARTESPSSDD